MATASNVLIYAEDWAKQLQIRLSEFNKWKDICRVEYTNTRVLNNPYMGDATVQTGTRTSPYTFQAVNETNESITINTFKILPQIIDRADLAQSTYSKQMELADRQGILLNEAIETAMYASHASFTDFGSENLTGSSGSSNITVSATNVDDIITHMIRTIRAANGEDLATRNGMFIVWRPADFQLLTTFAMANGFTTADMALKDGVRQGFEYMGVTHYTSNKMTSGHLFGGVKKALHLGIVKDTYGQVVQVQDPASTSGIGIISRVDYAFKVWTNVLPVLFDINVA